jgi:hypothetical protein
MEEQQNFLYEYTKFCLEQAQHGVDTLGTKLSGVMEISALLLLGLRVTSTFQIYVKPEQANLYFVYLSLKLSACVALAIAIAFSVLGLYPRKVVTTGLSPEVLMQKNESLQTAITNTWMQQIEDLQTYKTERTVFLRKAMISLGIGIAIASLATTDAFMMAITSKQ